MKFDGRFEDDMEMGEKTRGRDRSKRHHKIMTMEDVADNLKKDFGEEIADSKKYFSMAMVAEKTGNERDCHYLTEMAKDEYTHAYFIYEFMHEHDIRIPEEQEEDFEELKEKMSEFF